jgi:hypothetical protein
MTHSKTVTGRQQKEAAFPLRWIEDGNMSAWASGPRHRGWPLSTVSVFDLLALRGASNIQSRRGERDAENLWRIDLPATSMFGTATAASHHDCRNWLDMYSLSTMQIWWPPSAILFGLPALPLDNTPASLHVLPAKEKTLA